MLKTEIQSKIHTRGKKYKHVNCKAIKRRDNQFRLRTQNIEFSMFQNIFTHKNACVLRIFSTCVKQFRGCRESRPTDIQRFRHPNKQRILIFVLLAMLKKQFLINKIQHLGTRLLIKFAYLFKGKDRLCDIEIFFVWKKLTWQFLIEL